MGPMVIKNQRRLGLRRSAYIDRESVFSVLWEWQSSRVPTMPNIKKPHRNYCAFLQKGVARIGIQNTPACNEVGGEFPVLGMDRLPSSARGQK